MSQRMDVSLLFKEAKKIDLATWVETNIGIKPRLFAGGKWRRYSCCPNCGQGSENSVRMTVGHSGFWSCYVCNEKGDVVDAARMFWKCTKVEAAYRLINAVAVGCKVQQQLSPKALQEADVVNEKKAIALSFVLERIQDISKSSALDLQTERYLTDERKIPDWIVHRAKSTGLLASLPSDPVLATRFLLNHFTREQLEMAGLWKTGAKMPGIAYRPLVFISPDVDSAEFRILHIPNKNEVKSIRYGSMRRPWTWPGTWNGHLIVEGAIDMMSAVALGYKGTVIGLPGCNSWVDHPEWFSEIEEGTSAFDNDASKPKNPGQMWTKRLQEFFAENGKILRQFKMPADQDLNELLKHQTLAR